MTMQGRAPEGAACGSTGLWRAAQRHVNDVREAETIIRDAYR